MDCDSHQLWTTSGQSNNHLSTQPVYSDSGIGTSYAFAILTILLASDSSTSSSFIAQLALATAHQVPIKQPFEYPSQCTQTVAYHCLSIFHFHHTLMGIQ